MFLQRLDQVFSKLNQHSKVSGLGDNWNIHWLKVITTFIKRFDYEHILEENINKYNVNTNMEVPVTLVTLNVTKNVLVNSNMKIWQLIIQIGKAFRMRSSEFRIDTSSGPIEITIYNDLISTYQIKTLRIKRLDDKVLDKENPRRLIA